MTFRSKFLIARVLNASVVVQYSVNRSHSREPVGVHVCVCTHFRVLFSFRTRRHLFIIRSVSYTCPATVAPAVKRFPIEFVFIYYFPVRQSPMNFNGYDVCVAIYHRVLMLTIIITTTTPLPRGPTKEKRRRRSILTYNNNNLYICIYNFCSNNIVNVRGRDMRRKSSLLTATAQTDSYLSRPPPPPPRTRA